MFDWLEHMAQWLVYHLLGMNPEDHLAKALDFFIYDSIKILLLLFTVVFLMGIINSYFPIDRVKNYLSRNKLYGTEYFMASLFGVTFAFLVTSPLVNEVAIGLFVGLFGVKTTILYVLSGVLLGTIAGLILQRLKLEKFLTPWVKEVLANAKRDQERFEEEKQSFKQRLPIIWDEALKILKGVLPYVIIGIAIGGLMHGYIPEGFFEKYMAKDNLFAVPIATILAIPMYSNASGILPIVQVLVDKGIPLGTAIAFMMGVVGLSLPEAMLLKKVMTIKLIGIFFGVVMLCIIVSGYLFNLIL